MKFLMSGNKNLLWALFLFCQVGTAAVLSGVETLAPAIGKPAESGLFLMPSGAIPANPARVKIDCTAAGLVFTVTRYFPASKELAIKGTPDEPWKIFHGETIEFFLCPHAERPEIYYQFGVNPAGVLYQAKGADTAWRPVKRITVKTAVGKDFWSATLQVPFGAFGEADTVWGKTVWRANFVCGGANWSGAGDLHDAASFGRLAFGGADPSPVRIDALFLEPGPARSILIKFLPSPGEWTVCEGSCGTAEKMGDSRFCKNIQTQGKDGERVERWVLDGQKKREVPQKKLEDLSLHFQACDPGGRHYELNTFADGDAPELLVLDQYYYDADGDVKISYSAPEFEAEKMEIRIRALDADRAETVFPASGAGTVNAGKLAPGVYAFRISGKGGAYTSCTFSVRARAEKKVPAARPERLTLFPGRPEVLAVTDARGVSTPVYPILGEKLNPSVRMSSCLSYGYVSSPAAGYVFDSELEKSMAGAARSIASRRGPTLFQMCYEAQMALLIRGEDGKTVQLEHGAEHYGKLYRALKTRYPETLFSIHADGQRDAETLARNCDVFEMAYWGSSYASALIPNLRRDLRRTKGFAGAKPVLFWLGGSLPNGKIRIADELRAGIFLSLIEGMAGNTIHLGHGSVPPGRTRMWSLMTGIQDEIAAWYPRWAAGRDTTLKTVAPDGVSIRARTAPDGAILLLVVNRRASEQRFTYLPRMSGPAPAASDFRTILLPGYAALMLLLQPLNF